MITVGEESVFREKRRGLTWRSNKADGDYSFLTEEWKKVLLLLESKTVPMKNKNCCHLFSLVSKGEKLSNNFWSNLFEILIEAIEWQWTDSFFLVSCPNTCPASRVFKNKSVSCQERLGQKVSTGASCGTVISQSRQRGPHIRQKLNSHSKMTSKIPENFDLQLYPFSFQRKKTRQRIDCYEYFLLLLLHQKQIS